MPQASRSSGRRSRSAGFRPASARWSATWRTWTSPPGNFDLVWSEGALYNVGIERALRTCSPLLEPGGYVAFTDAVWRKVHPPPEVKASFDLDYPTMGRVPDVLTAIARCGFSLVGHFTLPDEAWWDDFYSPMQRRIAELRGTYAADSEALAVLDQFAQEPEMYRLHSEYYAYLPASSSSSPTSPTSLDQP